MRRLLVIALVIPLLANCGSSGSRRPDAPPPKFVTWVRLEHLQGPAIAGAKVFESARCLACHVYAGSGSSMLGAPELTAIGMRRLGVAFEIRHLECPSCVNPGSPMPAYASLGRTRLRQLAIFLEASKGTH